MNLLVGIWELTTENNIARVETYTLERIFYSYPQGFRIYDLVIFVIMGRLWEFSGIETFSDVYPAI